ncbi:XRE family transcriptional regulator [Pseudomonas putida S11]|nr:XRE family transcriptional regulator [Pseudomonas putida S11]
MDALYVLSGIRTPAPLEGLSADESGLLGAFRQLSFDDQAALWHLLRRFDQQRQIPTDSETRLRLNLRRFLRKECVRSAVKNFVKVAGSNRPADEVCA